MARNDTWPSQLEDSLSRTRASKRKRRRRRPTFDGYRLFRSSPSPQLDVFVCLYVSV